MMRKILVPFFLAAIALTAAVSSIGAGPRHISASLEEVDGSGVVGRVELTRIPRGGTLITLMADGLRPGAEYVSLHAEDPTCGGEATDSERSLIARFKATQAGMITITRRVRQDLDSIGSVSVRRAEGLGLEACADVVHE